MNSVRFYPLIYLATIVVLFCVGGACKKKNIKEESKPQDGVKTIEVRKPQKFSSQKFPKALFFRIMEDTKSDYATWEKEFSRLDGVISKIGFDELEGLDQKTLTNRLRRLANSTKEQQIFLHFNGEARDPYQLESGKYFPGHWLYLPGSSLKKNLSPSTTTITVEQPQRFIEKAMGGGKDKIYTDLVIVPIGDDGKKDWAAAEHVRLLSIDEKSRQLVVKRGAFGSSARTFKAGRAYIAPHATKGPYGKAVKANKLWVYNFSTQCPKNAKGETATDVLVGEFGEWLKPGGAFDFFDGVVLDVAPWKMFKAFGKGQRADINNDGKPGQGKFAKGRDYWAEGYWQFLKKLREEVGDEVILMADGHGNNAQRGIGILNGIEFEGLCGPGDGYRAFSQSVNFMTYWKENTPPPYTGYVVPKNTDKKTLFRRVDMYRLAHATATIFGYGICNWKINSIDKHARIANFDHGIMDELVKGAEGENNWLGSPVGTIIRLGQSSTDELGGAGKRMDAEFIARFLSKGNNISFTKTKRNELQISPSRNVNRLDFDISHLEANGGDFLCYFKAKSLAPLPNMEHSVPREINVSLEGVSPSPHSPSKIKAFVGMDEFALVAVYFREVPKGKVTLSFQVEGSGDVLIKDFTLHHAPPALAREFEQGLVLANPSVEPYTFDLEKLFPHGNWKRIKASYGQDGKINDGQPVRTGKITVPPVNGIFLARQ